MLRCQRWLGFENTIIVPNRSPTRKGHCPWSWRCLSFTVVDWQWLKKCAFQHYVSLFEEKVLWTLRQFFKWFNATVSWWRIMNTLTKGKIRLSLRCSSQVANAWHSVVPKYWLYLMIRRGLRSHSHWINALIRQIVILGRQVLPECSWQVLSLNQKISDGMYFLLQNRIWQANFVPWQFKFITFSVLYFWNEPYHQQTEAAAGRHFCSAKWTWCLV